MNAMLSSAISLVILSLLVPAHAQEQVTEAKPNHVSPTPDAAKKDKQVERIPVTGTRIKRMDMLAAAPLTVLGREEIQASGKQTVTDIIKALPASIGNSVTTSTTVGGSGGSGNITLRGLDPSSTLVLLNGRRLPLDANGSSPDINSIPVAAVERIEILQEGASAIYGSDAIAGVINIITRTNWEGTDVSLYYGQASRGDLQTKSIDLTYGTSNDKGGMLLGTNVYSNGSVKSRDRDVSKDTLRPSPTTPDARVKVEGKDLISNTTWNGATPTPDDFHAFKSSDLYNYAAITDAIMALDRRSVFMSGDYALTKSLKGFVDSYFTNTFSTYNFAPTPLSLVQQTGELTVSKSNPYNPFGIDLKDVSKRFLQFGPRVSETESETFRSVVGIEGKLADWSWDIAYNHGESRTRSTIKNLVNKLHLQLGIGDPVNCEAVKNLGCVPVNLLGPDGSLTPEMIDWLRIEATDFTKTKTDAYTLNFSGDLVETGFGTIGLALGAEARDESYQHMSDPNSEQYNTIGSTNAKSTDGGRQVKEAYIELIVPMTKLAELDLAARFSDYSDFGQTTNPKFGLKISPIDGLTFRGSYSTGFRAPSLIELYQGQAEKFAFIGDPCQEEGRCAVQANPDVQQFLALQGGNPELDPEKSKSFTYGVAYSIANFNGKIDYFAIKTDNAINTSAQYILNQFRENGKFTDKVILDDENNVKSIKAIALNLASRKVEGVDMAFDYSLRGTPSGTYNFNLMGSHYIKYMNQADKSAPFENIVGQYIDAASDGRGSIPKWKGLFDLGWSNYNFEAGTTANYVSKLEVPGAAIHKELPAWTTYDLRVGYDFITYGKLFLGVNNLTDKEPPITEKAANDNIDARTHNLIGRYYYARWGVQL